ncbi:MAG: DUF1573 domain-containing protein [Deltaproteobacteria bacterium]|nr:DUF1573 domain-containing protein [Deltaproteobacteria bacterium]
MISGTKTVILIVITILSLMAAPVLAAEQSTGKASKPAASTAQTPTPPATAQPVAPAAPGLQPQLAVPEMSFDFGNVKPDTEVTHDFVMENKGKGELVIESVTPGCGCTVVTFDPKIQPGGTGKISLSIKIAPDWAGKEFVKKALVKTNDPEQRMKQFILTLNGNVEGQTSSTSEPKPSQPESAKSGSGG